MFWRKWSTNLERPRIVFTLSTAVPLSSGKLPHPFIHSPTSSDQSQTWRRLVLQPLQFTFRNSESACAAPSLPTLRPLSRLWRSIVWFGWSASYQLLVDVQPSPVSFQRSCLVYICDKELSDCLSAPRCWERDPKLWFNPRNNSVMQEWLRRENFRIEYKYQNQNMTDTVKPTYHWWSLSTDFCAYIFSLYLRVVQELQGKSAEVSPLQEEWASNPNQKVCEEQTQAVDTRAAVWEQLQLALGWCLLYQTQETFPTQTHCRSRSKDMMLRKPLASRWPHLLFSFCLNRFQSSLDKRFSFESFLGTCKTH